MPWFAGDVRVYAADADAGCFARAAGVETVEEISDPEMPGQYQSSGFNMAGTHFYYLSDAGREFMALVEYDIEGNLLYSEHFKTKTTTVDSRCR